MDKVSILVLEDSPLDAELVRLQIEKSGIPADVRHVVTGEQFKEALS